MSPWQQQRECIWSFFLSPALFLTLGTGALIFWNIPEKRFLHHQHPAFLQRDLATCPGSTQFSWWTQALLTPQLLVLRPRRQPCQQGDPSLPPRGLPAIPVEGCPSIMEAERCLPCRTVPVPWFYAERNRVHAFLLCRVAVAREKMK